LIAGKHNRDSVALILGALKNCGKYDIYSVRLRDCISNNKFMWKFLFNPPCWATMAEMVKYLGDLILRTVVYSSYLSL